MFTTEHPFDMVPSMADLLPHEIERLRRSVAMAAPGGPSGLNRHDLYFAC
jgi:hypothetical protein